jgi:glycosyltransferase involved in cell wall biosynthesis
MSEPRPRVLIVRGHQANPWELRPWTLLGDAFDVRFLRTGRTWFDVDHVKLASRSARTLRDVLPPGRLGDLAVRLPGDRYLNPKEALAGADIVHAQELGYWYSMQAARLKQELGFKLVLTVWETLPFADSYRNFRTRAYRQRTLEHADLFLAATERARDALILEGADPARIRVSAPGVDIDRFSTATADVDEHVVLSAGRLVWEKGHQDVIRALAALRAGVVAGPVPRLIIIGTGPERDRLKSYAAELGVADRVEVRDFVPYDDMPGVYASATCLVLASLPVWSWEEQFGMVLAEAMAAGLPIVASTSGAIPEVVGPGGGSFAPGDWLGLARALAAGPLAHPPGRRDPASAERAQRYSLTACATRLRDAYGELLA